MPQNTWNQSREDELIYVDDTKLINEHDTPQQIVSKLQNYQKQKPEVK